jgi:phage shock protein A
LLASANATLKEKQDALAAVMARVDSLKQQLANAQSEQRKLTDQVRLLMKNKPCSYFDALQLVQQA